jgi:hypothetical protein
MMRTTTTLLLTAALLPWNAPADSIFGIPAELMDDHLGVGVPAGVSPEQEEQAILWAAKYRHWILVNRQPGTIVLKYSPTQEFSATVSVAYDAHAVSIDYVDSVNLKYGVENGQRMIHHNYNRWVYNLANDVGIEMLRMTLK